MTDASDPYNAILVHRHDLNEDLAIFRVAFRNGSPVPDFEPGQFTSLGLIAPAEDQMAQSPRRRARGPRLTRRAYSIASPAQEKRFYEFYLVRVADGRLTPRLWELQSGDPLFMDPNPKGHFTLEGIPQDRNVVMVATGTGLAPYRSMIQSFPFAGTNRRWNRLAVLHSCRREEDLGYREEFKERAREDSQLVYLPTCTREPEHSPWSGLRERIHGLLEPERFKTLAGFELDPATTHLLLCGHPEMIDQCEALLQKRGFLIRGREHPDGTLHFERYW